MMEAMAGDERIKRADDRMNEFLSKTLEKEDKKRKAKEDGEKRRKEDEEEEAQKVEEDDKEMESPARAEQGGQMPGSSQDVDNKRPAWADIEDEEEDVREHKRRMVDLVWLAGAVNQDEAEEEPDAVWTADSGEAELDPE